MGFCSMGVEFTLLRRRASGNARPGAMTFWLRGLGQVRWVERNLNRSLHGTWWPLLRYVCGSFRAALLCSSSSERRGVGTLSRKQIFIGCILRLKLSGVRVNP